MADGGVLDKRETALDTSDDVASTDAMNREEAKAQYDFMAIARMAEDRDQTFKTTIQRTAWRRNLRALRNRHAVDSKYESDTYRGRRSTIFRPKTLSAVRKNMASAAAALFSTSEVVSVEAEHDDNPRKQAGAEAVKHLLNYRLDRTSTRGGVPWFLVAMGANRDSQAYGVCYSKQAWEFEEHTQEFVETVTEAEVYADTGEPVIDPAGQPVITQRQEQIQEIRVMKDRPMVWLIAPDNLIMDPAAHWYNPVQTSMYLGIKFPMTIEDAETMLANPGKSGTKWLPLSREQLQQASEEYTSKGVRTARGDGTDRYQARATSQSGDKGGSGIVWMHEWFIRIHGCDYTFWTVGTRFYASEVRETIEAYPEQFGERPVTGGYGAIEPHETYPMAAVTAWEEMQRELNEIVNLRLDVMKQALSPIAKVKQGTMFDYKQLQNRAAQDTTVIVKNMDDLEFDRTPDVAQSAYEEANYLNNDFDDLAGVFSGGSVSSNRQLNETVGGMRLLSGAANSVTEFDLRVWVETWVEPTLRQVVRLEQMWETDEMVLAIAGERARLERFGVDHLEDQDLVNEVSLRVNVGIGSADPMQKLQKLQAALQILMTAAPFFDKQVMVNAEEMIKEVMGPAGYNDGMRLFVISEHDASTGDPEAMAAQMEAELRQKEMELEAQLADQQNQTDVEIARQQGQTEILKEVIKSVAMLKAAQAKLRYDVAIQSRSLVNQKQIASMKNEAMKQMPKAAPKKKAA